MEMENLGGLIPLLLALVIAGCLMWHQLNRKQHPQVQKARGKYSASVSGGGNDDSSSSGE